jgi:putative SbcD/Mre11-related phosphoesterase
MKILKDFEIINTCLFLAKSKTLIIPDVHIGYEEALNKQGILIPRVQFKDIMQSIERVIKNAISRYKNINKIIIIGDLKHEFGMISETEWRQTLKFIDYLQRYCKDIVLLKGNHDKILGPIANKRGLQIVENIIVDNILFMHGHELPLHVDKSVKTIIIGHEHTAISLKDGPRVERFKCFLKGRWIQKERKKELKGIIGSRKEKLKKPVDLIVMPSFNPIVEGTDVLQNRLLSPFLKDADLNEFEVFIIGDKVYNFGRLKQLIRKLKNT